MAKKVVGKIKLQIEAGKANPSPPVGPALGQHGVNIMDFCKQFNARTESQAGYIIPVVIDVYEDRSFTFVTKSPPAPVLIKKALNLSKGSAVPNKTKVAEITREQLEEIAKIKMKFKCYFYGSCCKHDKRLLQSYGCYCKRGLRGNKR